MSSLARSACHSDHPLVVVAIAQNSHTWIEEPLSQKPPDSPISLAQIRPTGDFARPAPHSLSYEPHSQMTASRCTLIAGMQAVRRTGAAATLPHSSRVLSVRRVPCTVFSRSFSISGMPDLPGLGPSTALPSPLGQQPLPSPSALPSPVILPPLSPRSAGIDSPGDEGTDTTERKGSKGGGVAGGGGPSGGIPQGGVGPPSLPRPTHDQPGGIEQGKGGPRIPPRGTVPEEQLRQPGPAHPSDTPELPQPPATPSDRPEAQRERAEAASERARQAERIARGDDGDGQVREAALPPPPGLGGPGGLRPRSRSASSQSFHRGPPDEIDTGGGNGGLWARIKRIITGRR